MKLVNVVSSVKLVNFVNNLFTLERTVTDMESALLWRMRAALGVMHGCPEVPADVPSEYAARK